MDFSDHWKSFWSVSSFFPAPLLLPSLAAKPLGPLLFRPSHQNPNPTLLLSCPSLTPQLPPPLPTSSFRSTVHGFYRGSEHTFVPNSLLNSIFLDAISQSPHDLFSRPNLENSLQMIKRANGDIILFFPTGRNSDCIGYVILSSLPGCKHRIVVDEDGNSIFILKRGLNHRIFRLSATAFEDATMNYASSSGNSAALGFLVACTLYSVHWFKIECENFDPGIPVLVHLAHAEFRHCVSHACWSPHLQEECMVLLENGELRVFGLNLNMNSCLGDRILPVKLSGMKVRYAISHLGSSVVEKGGWFSCEFSWHPRIVVVACSAAVFLVDFRLKETKVDILAKIEMCDSFRVHSIMTDRFIAFGRAGFNDFWFSVATEYHLLLYDIRQPLAPVLQWDHGLDSPHYINMFRLSELRPSLGDGTFSWASESGFVSLVGSFWNGEFSLFCYGPTFPAGDSSVACQFSKFCNSLYAWELPSGVPLSGCLCRSGDCLAREEFSKAVLPGGIDLQQKKDMVLGFCILADDIFSFSSEFGLEDSSKTDGLGGFTLIRLVSSGKLESQRYSAFCNLDSSQSNSKEASLCFEGSLLYSRDQEDEFHLKRRFLKVKYLLGYLNDNLSNVLTSEMQKKPCTNCAETREDPSTTIPWTLDSRELIRDKLRDAGVNQIGSFSTISGVLSEITSPASIYEIIYSTMWSGLSLVLLQLAFFKYSDLLAGQKTMPIEFLDVETTPCAQLLPIFFRQPSSKSDGWSCKASQSDFLVGPVLPLPVILTFKHINEKEKTSSLGGHVGDFSSETEVIHHCEKMIKVAKDLLSLDVAHSTSLAGDEEKWALSQLSQTEKSFFLFEPMECSDPSTMCDEKNATVDTTFKHLVQEEPNQMDQVVPPLESISSNKKFCTLVSGIQNKESNPIVGQELVGEEMFDDLSPVRLSFESPAQGFKLDRCLKKQFLKWLESYKPYEDFCTSLKIPKQAQ